ncbi:MAG: peptide MFS transporter [Candidatus Eisenbacteria bacterium]|nr:peptide MFS transporter [Candidatus Eisenbacteria bacterium]
MSNPTVPQSSDTTWMGHPRGLMTLFFTELWERFSYYGMRGILVLFLVDAMRGGFHMSTATAAAIYGLYTSMVYLVALPGGWIADNLTGQRNAIFAGGVIIACGHFSMAIPTTYTFYQGLILIIIGTGLLKPNVSAIVGGLYPEGGARRDAGFSIFYMGINIGALCGPLICGYLGENVNWHYGFGAAGVGMVLGLIQYRLGYKYFHTVGVMSREDKERSSSAKRKLAIGVGSLVGVIALLAILRLSVFKFTIQGFAQGLGYFVIVLAILYFSLIIFLGKLETAEKKRVAVIFLLFIGAALFWSGFEQAGSSMNLFAERLTDRVLLGWEMPASWLQSVNPVFIIVLAPVFGWLWVALASKKREPSIPVKFFAGLVLLGVGFLVMAWGSLYVSGSGPGVSPMWLVVTYFMHTLGELCLSPVGLSSVTKLAPKRLVGQMMGTWFMGAALGNLIAGLVAGRFETLPLPKLFLIVAVTAAGTGFLFLIFSKPIRRLIDTRTV